LAAPAFLGKSAATDFSAAKIQPVRQRPSSRLLVIDPLQRVLLFRFTHTNGALGGQTYWATPGGGVEAEETFEDAAIRELWEETGIVIDDPGPQIAQRKFELQLPGGEFVHADERYFRIQVSDNVLSTDAWTANEIECMTDYKWWSLQELATSSEIVWPENLISLLNSTHISRVL
jgi:8-oxo-dGTP diphosphatase